MSTKNIGQVAGVHIGNTPPENTILIWYDNTPSQLIHKIYDVNLKQWVVLDKNTISIITYSELTDLATDVGLSVGAWFKISDKNNVLSLVITSTKIQYNDSLGNILIDDLGTNIQYHVTSSNLSIDDVVGVFDDVNKKLIFQFNEQIPDNVADDFILGKTKKNNIWQLSKYKLSSFLSKITGNSIIWNSGFFFNFNSSIKNILDKTGGIVSKEKYDYDKKITDTTINNIGKDNQTIITNASNAISNATTDAAIYNKKLPSDLVTGTEAVDSTKGDTLYDIISKIQRWINKFKYATGIKISSTFTQATSQQSINNNDNVESALGKIQFWLKNIPVKLSSIFTPYNYEEDIDDLTAGDSFEEAFKKVQGKFNQIGEISDGVISSKMKVENTTLPVTEIDLYKGEIKLRSSINENSECIMTVNDDSPIIQASNSEGLSSIDPAGIFSNGSRQGMNISGKVSILGIASNSVSQNTSNSAFLAAIGGKATNSLINGAPAFGGYFDKLKMNGMYLSSRKISNDYIVMDTDVIINCYNTGSIFITLPYNPYSGQVIYITQKSNFSITISPGSTTGTTETLIVTTNSDKGKTFMLLWDDTIWTLNTLN